MPQLHGRPLVRRQAWFPNISVFAALIFMTTLLGYALHYSKGSDSIATMWLASGVFLGMLLVSPYQQWIMLITVGLVARTAADVIMNETGWFAAGGASSWYFVAGAANTLEGVLGAAIMRWILRHGSDLSRTPSVVVLLIAAAVCTCAASAVVGSIGVIWSSPETSFLAIWQMWWFSDAIGILVATPVMLAYWNPPRHRTHESKQAKVTEAAALLASLLIAVVVFLGAQPLSGQVFTDHPYVLIPWVIWACVRFDSRVTSLTTLVIALGVTVSADFERGPFILVGDTPLEDVLAMQLFVASIAVMGLILTSSFSAWRGAEVELKQELIAVRHHERHQRLLVNELNHRIRNNLASLLALADLTHGGKPNADRDDASFRSLIKRLRAMNAVHNVLSKTQWQPAEILEIVEATIHPELESAGVPMRVDGPEVMVSATKCPALAICLHELAHLRLHHGAGKDSDVVITWQRANGAVRLVWEEHSSHPVDVDDLARERLALIEGFVRHELRGVSYVDTTNDGWRCTIEFHVEDVDDEPWMLESEPRQSQQHPAPAS